MPRDLEWPEWWGWEIELTGHARDRMDDRNFNETDLRLMLAEATGFRKTREEDRFLVETAHQGDPSAVIVEPDRTDQILVVVTAYRVSRPV